MQWKTIERPGSFGDKKAEIIKKYNLTYGQDNWRVVHQYNKNFLFFIKVCKIFEEAYFQDSFRRSGLWRKLRDAGKDVYDIEELDVKSGLDYLIQDNVATHIQDIAIRNVFARRNWYFKGEDIKEFIKELKDRINSPINAESLRGYNVQRLWFFKELDKLAGEKLI